MPQAFGRFPWFAVFFLRARRLRPVFPMGPPRTSVATRHCHIRHGRHRNLATNAAKYGVGGTITISARQVPDFVSVSVTDEGPGIPEEHQAHLFEPFFRVPGDQWSISGTGFGLSIVRRYVELHGGEVTCESSPGIGTTFAFTVPRFHLG